MLLKNDGQPDHECSVSSAKTGRQFDRIELNGRDVQQLRKLSPEALREWLDYWACGFAPVKRTSVGREDDNLNACDGSLMR